MTEFEKLQNEVNGSLYIMASVYNQGLDDMPLPHKLFNFALVLDISVENRRSNVMADKTISFRPNEMNKIKDITKRIEREILRINSKDKIFWNLCRVSTAFLFAIYDIVRLSKIANKTHYLCYSEGNYGEMRILQYKNGELQDDFTNCYDYIPESER